ncbi:MAG: patatin-like phospholipase family protein [Bacteroidia bacterium]|nr:patatin-like phospholipase family protein [Bacteroidia bacterium]
MKNLIQIISAIRFSLPVRLVVRQIRHHKTVLLFWLVLIGFLSGAIGKNLGVAFLFLEPEYMGEESFWSLFLVGSALGMFLFAYSIIIYINESYRFHFLAFTNHPFFTLAFNNFIIPSIFIIWYYYDFISYHNSLHGGFNFEVFDKILGLTTGIFFVFLISATYFFANRTIVHRYSRKLEKGIAQSSKHNRKVIISKAKESFKDKQRADSYLVPFRAFKVNSEMYGDFRQVIKVLNQHHGKLLLFQVFVFLMIAVLGFLEGNVWFQIPAGATVLLIFSLGLMVMGALRFWFRQSSILTVAVAMVIFLAYNEMDLFKTENQAFGMNYETEEALYTHEALHQLQKQEYHIQDKQAAIRQLDNWKAAYQAKYGTEEKPRAVLVTASGGGLRSAFWTFRVLQCLDSISHGRMTDEMRFMSGASGGTFGLAYFRELYMRRQMGEIDSLMNPRFQENISQDILNRIIFKKFTDLILPNRKVSFGNNKYDWETGYSFDQQISQNLPELAQRRLGDYAEYEELGKIPLLVLSPTILNQGRQLFISSSPISYLTKPNQVSNQFETRSKGIEFRRMFKDQEADSLWMITALRMNATFPLVLPVVELPSKPRMEIMDAGAIDNYGTTTAMKYLFEMKEWFAENTSSIVYVQIRDNVREDPIKKNSKKDILNEFLTPLGGGVYSMAQAKDLGSDFLLEFLDEWYPGIIEVVPVVYPKEIERDPASLSWHLTLREKRNIEKSLFLTYNQQSFLAVSELYKSHLLAKIKKD